MSRLAQRLLFLDGGAGSAVGLGVLTLREWLAELYAMPLSLVTFIGAANLAYGCYSGALAGRAWYQKGPSCRAIDGLIAANLAWTVVCAALVVTTFRSASALGLGHLVLEGMFVAWLALAERKLVRPFAR